MEFSERNFRFNMIKMNFKMDMIKCFKNNFNGVSESASVTILAKLIRALLD